MGEPFDTDYSGTTCVSVYVTPEALITANVGDSRAILGRRDIVQRKWDV